MNNQIKRIKKSDFGERKHLSFSKDVKPLVRIDEAFTKKFTSFTYCQDSNVAVTGFDSGEVRN
jgi:hypothetical protein